MKKESNRAGLLTPEQVAEMLQVKVSQLIAGPSSNNGGTYETGSSGRAHINAFGQIVEGRRLSKNKANGFLGRHRDPIQRWQASIDSRTPTDQAR